MSAPWGMSSMALQPHVLADGLEKINMGELSIEYTSAGSYPARRPFPGV